MQNSSLLSRIRPQSAEDNKGAESTDFISGVKSYAHRPVDFKVCEKYSPSECCCLKSPRMTAPGRLGGDGVRREALQFVTELDTDRARLLVKQRSARNMRISKTFTKIGSWWSLPILPYSCQFFFFFLVW